MQSRLKLSTLCALLASAAILTGCGPQGGEPAAGTTTGGAKPAESAKTKMVFIAKNSGNPFFDRVEKGFHDVEGDLNLEFAAQSPTAADPTSQIPIIKDQIQRGVGVIVISSNSPDALNEVLDEAKAKGIMVITVDSDLDGNEEHRSVGVKPVDPTDIGKGQLELLGKSMDYEGEFAILSATTDAPNQNAWIEIIKETLGSDPKYAKMKLVATVYGDDDSQKSSTETEALLTKHPNLRGILSPTSVGLAAAAQVIENAGVYPGGSKAKGKGLVLTGLSTPNQLKGALDKGVVSSFQLWDPADMGAIAAYIGAKKLELKPGDKFEVPGKGEFTVGEKNIVFAGKLLTFDKANIADYDF